MLERILAWVEAIARFLGVPEPTPPPTTTTLPPVTTTTTAAPTEAVLTFPAGTVKTKVPQGTGQAYGFPWEQVSRWEPLYTRAGNEFGVAPLLLAAFSIIESNANHYRTGQRMGTRFDVLERGSDAFDNVPAVGMMQIKLGYHDPTNAFNAYTPEGNLRLGAKLLAQWIREEGSWEAALTNKYFPGDDAQSGITQREYIRAIRDLIAEVKASWPQTTTTTAAPSGKVNPYPKPVIYDLVRDGARFGVTAGEAARLRQNCFPNRNGARPLYMILHTQSGNTTGSLDWWLYGPGVQASATVMAQKDGSILQVIPERDGPWTNGDVCNPTPKSAGLRALGGNPNIHSLTIEAEGDTNVAYTDAQFRALLWQFADWMLRYDLPLDHLLSHASINQCSRALCPGDAHMIQVVNQLRADGF